MEKTLDLSHAIAGETLAAAGKEPASYPQMKWRIKIGEVVYGPYTRSRLVEFLKEGRVLASTLIAIGDDDVFVRADRHANLRWDFSTSRKRKFGEPKVDGENEARVSNYFVSARLTADAEAVEHVLAECGKFAKIAGDMWVLRSTYSIQGLRSRILPVLRPNEQIVIVNATKDRLAWCNLGLQGDLAIRDVWDAEIEG